MSTIGDMGAQSATRSGHRNRVLAARGSSLIAARSVGRRRHWRAGALLVDLKKPWRVELVLCGAKF